jgi:hypothetical protein
MTHIDLTKPVEIPSWLKIAARPTSIGNGELERQWHEIGEETTEAILKVLPTGKYTMGPYLKVFEDEFAKYSKCKYGLGGCKNYPAHEGDPAGSSLRSACGYGPNP